MEGHTWRKSGTKCLLQVIVPRFARPLAYSWPPCPQFNAPNTRIARMAGVCFNKISRKPVGPFRVGMPGHRCVAPSVRPSVRADRGDDVAEYGLWPCCFEVFSVN